MGDDGINKKLEVLGHQLEEHKQLLWYMALGMCFDNETEARDLVQDMAARMVAKVKEGTFDPSDPEFVTLARRHMANRRKARWSKVETKRLRLLWDATQSLEDRGGAEPSAEEAYIEKEDDVLVAEMHDAVYERLPKQGYSRPVFELSREGIFDEKTTAARLGIEVTQVNDARKTIRAKIKEVLEEHGLKMPQLRKKKVGITS